MSDMADRLYALLPAIHRIRDAEQGGPLREFFEVLASQAAVLEEDVEQFYDDLFIETCAEWVVPYIGDLIGYRSLHHLTPGLGSPRAEVANTIGYRRRKGTAAMLEQLARDVTGWPAKVTEFFQLLATSQFMNHVRLHSTLTPDLRRWERMEDVEGPFDVLAHSADTRRIATGEGRHGISNIGIFLWRLGAYRLSGSPAVEVDGQRFRFHPAGRDAPLFNRPETEASVTHLAEHRNVPEPLSRRRLSEFLTDYYGKDKSAFLDGVEEDAVMICNLSDHAGGWAHTPPPAGKVAIDPVLGRIAFGEPPSSPPAVLFHYGFSADMGGGEYERAASFDLAAEPVQPVAAPGSIQDALDARVPGEAVQVQDSGRYLETLALTVQPGERLELRAANGRRPTLVQGGELVISGGDAHAEVSLNGLMIVGGPIRVTGVLRRLRLRHCTLVPGLTMDGDGVPQQPGAPSLIVESGGVAIEVDHCIVGGIRWHDLSRLEIQDSIVDAAAETETALAGLGAPVPGSLDPPGGILRVHESTIIGKIHVRQMELVSNAILSARTDAGDGWPAGVIADRRQTGCIRFSYVPAEARTPRRYRCQPDWEERLRIAEAEREAKSKNQALTIAQIEALSMEVRSWMTPAFTSLRYGDPGYGQLRRRCPRQIREGADDEAAMGAFHDLYEPQRLINLRVRLEEYLRFGLEAGVFTVT